MNENELIEKSHKVLNRFALKARRFCDCYCVPDGLGDILKIYNITGTVEKDDKYSNKLSYDYDYFAFLKSTKTLMALKRLLNDKSFWFNEDCFLLIRSIFENHIMNRYVREHINIPAEKDDVIRKFILNPLAVTFNHFSLQGNNIVDDEGMRVGKIPMPAGFKMGEEENYYTPFYQFLCQYTHCSFGALTCYFDDHFYTYQKNNFQLLCLFFSLFVFTKIYEGVVTVEGENYDSIKEERSYYDLAYDSLELQLDLIEHLIAYYSAKPQEKIRFVIEKYLGEGSFDKESTKIIEMLTLMKASLFDAEIGSLSKSDFSEGKFTRKYPDLGFYDEQLTR